MTTGNESVVDTGTSKTDTADTTTTATTTVVDSGWMADLPADLKSMIETKGYKSPADLATAYVHAERAIGVDKIALPKDGIFSDPAARAKIGVPETPDKYKLDEIKMPDGVKYDEGFEKAILPVAHRLGLTPVQVNELRKTAAEHRLGEISGLATTSAAALTSAQAEMKKEFGAAYDVNILRASKAAEHFGLSAILNESGLGNHPEFIKAFAKIGLALGEDVIKTGQGAGGGMTPEEAKAEANKVMATEEYRSRTHPMHDEAVKKVAALFELQYPTAA